MYIKKLQALTMLLGELVGFFIAWTLPYNWVILSVCALAAIGRASFLTPFLIRVPNLLYSEYEMK